MQILLPIAGLGTRVRPHTHVRPKPMLSLAGKPILGHLMDSLLPLRPSSFIVIVGERGEAVEQYVRAHYTVPVAFRTQTELRGQSHAIKMAEDLISEPLLIVFGDSLFAAPLEQLVDRSVDGAICVKQVADPRRFGIVEEQNGLVSRLVEKPENPLSDLATIGVYMLNAYRGLLQAIDEQIASEDPVKGEFFIAGALQRMIARGDRLRAVHATGWWDTGTIEAVLDAHRHLVESHRRKPEFNPVAAIIEPCYIDPSAELERCAIGPYVTVGPHTVIVDSVVSDSIIGEGVRLTGQCLKRSIIGDYAEVHRAPMSFNVADHSSIGSISPTGHAH
jgi:glucose-1-phosphate thymidylyltransferase